MQQITAIRRCVYQWAWHCGRGDGFTGYSLIGWRRFLQFFL